MTAFKDLTERLDRLERQNRNLKRGLCGLSLAAVLILVGGAGLGEPTESGDVTFRTIHAQKIAITDRDGKERLVLELDAGEPSLTMLNHEGMQQVYLGINESWNDSAYLSVCSRRKNGAVDKQAVLVATESQGASAGKQKPGNSQLLLCDFAPKQETAAGLHMVRLSSGRLDELKPYFEIREFKEARENQVDFDLLMAEPANTGQRLFLNTTPDTTTVSGVE